MDIYDMALGDDVEMRDVDKRITELQEMDAEDREITADERARYDMLTLEDELVKLEELKASVGDFEGQFISDSKWEDYAYEYSRDVFGEAVDLPYWDTAKFAYGLQASYTTIRLLNYEFFYRR